MTEDDKALVEELREDGYNGHNPLCLKAADRIEALAAEAETAVYMREIAQGLGYPSTLEALEALADFRAALGETQ